MKKSEVTKLLNNEFAKRLSPLGFKKWKFGFVREKDNWYIKLGFSLIDYANVFPGRFSYGLGYIPVLNILKKALPANYEGPENAYPSIIGNEQSAMFDQKKYPVREYNISTEADALLMVNVVTDYFMNEVIPELENASNIAYLEKLKNSNPSDKDPFNGLILAKLAENPGYNELVIKYRELRKNWDDWNKRELETVISFLEGKTKDDLLNMSD